MNVPRAQHRAAIAVFDKTADLLEHADGHGGLADGHGGLTRRAAGCSRWPASARC
jgi:hypothetical protein